MSAQPIKPVMLLYGAEQTLVEKSLASIRSRLQGASKELDYQEFRGDAAELSNVLRAAETLPFLAEKRMIVVRQADKLTVEDSSALQGYVKNPLETTCLVFAAEKVDKRTALYRTIKDSGGASEYRTLRRGECLSWVGREFSKRGKKASYRVTNTLLDSVGQDLSRLEQEIEKLCLYVGERSDVTEKDADALIAKTVEARIFDLVDSLGRREKNKALMMATSLLTAGESPVFLLNMIIRQFRLLLKTKALLKRRIRGVEIAKTLRVLPFVAAKLEDQSRRFTEEEIMHVYELLLEADKSLKTSAIPPRILLEILINKI